MPRRASASQEPILRFLNLKLKCRLGGKLKFLGRNKYYFVLNSLVNLLCCIFTDQALTSDRTYVA
jgi:hypothetical protein